MKNKQKINISEIQFLGSSLDQLGRVFTYQGKIYRAVYENRKLFCKKLFSSGLIYELITKKLLVDSKISNYSIETNSIVLEHKKINISNPSEWSFSMLRDIAISILEINNICNKYGYELHDGHPWNITFNNNQPIFFDFGSIVEKSNRKNWIAIEEFINTVICPLFFYGKKEYFIAIKLLENPSTCRLHLLPPQTTTDSYLFRKFRQMIATKSVGLFLINIFLRKKLIYYFYKKLNKSYIEKNFHNNFKKTDWSNYQNIDLIEKENKNLFKRFHYVVDIINKIQNVDTIIDLAGNSGVMSLFLAKKCSFKKIINTDYDLSAIDAGYNFFKKNTQYSVGNYLLNFMAPIRKDVYKDFKSDIVIALAITHHLLLTQGFAIDDVLQEIKDYSEQYVFIEFMPLGLWATGQQEVKVPEWYNIDWFRENFKKKFKLKIEKTIESQNIKGVVQPHRVLFVGKVN